MPAGPAVISGKGIVFAGLCSPPIRLMGRASQSSIDNLLSPAPLRPAPSCPLPRPLPSFSQYANELSVGILPEPHDCCQSVFVWRVARLGWEYGLFPWPGCSGRHARAMPAILSPVQLCHGVVRTRVQAQQNAAFCCHLQEWGGSAFLLYHGTIALDNQCLWELECRVEVHSHLGGNGDERAGGFVATLQTYRIQYHVARILPVMAHDAGHAHWPPNT